VIQPGNESDSCRIRRCNLLGHKSPCPSYNFCTERERTLRTISVIIVPQVLCNRLHFNDVLRATNKHSICKPVWTLTHRVGNLKRVYLCSKYCVTCLRIPNVIEQTNTSFLTPYSSFKINPFNNH